MCNRLSTTGNTPPTLSITEPDGSGDLVTVGDSYNVTYDLSDPDDVVTVALFYDTDSTGLNGTAIGGCTVGSEGTGVTCSWNTAGVAPGSYYVYGVTNDGTNPDVTDYSPGQVTINAVGNTPPMLSITEPDGSGDVLTVGDSYNVTYDLSDLEDAITVALFYDTNNTGLNGTAIGGCTAGPEGTGVTCSWNTAGVAPGSYFVYGVTNDGTNPDVTDYSPGQVTINAVGNTPPTLSITEPDGSGDLVTVGDSYNLSYDLSDPDDAVTVALFYDTDSTGLNGTAIGGCTAGSEGTGVTCSWNTTGVTPGSYYVYGVTNDGTNPDVTDYSPGQITISSAGLITLTVQPSASDTYIRDGRSSGNNHGSQTSIWLKKSIVGYNRRGILGFDFTALDDSAVIESAYLDLYYFDNSIGVNPVGETVEVNRVTQTDWVEGEATWNNYKNAIPWTTAGGDYTVTDQATVVMPAAYGWVRWTVTDQVKYAQSNTSEIANLLVKFVSSASSNVGARFYTKEFTTDQSKQPKLIINYSTTGNTPPTLSITEPDGSGDLVTVGDSYNVIYDLSDPDDVVTVALFYDTDSTGLNGTAIGGCTVGSEGTGVTCSWNTAGVAPGSYYVYGVTNDGTNPDVTDYSPGQVTINVVGNTSPTLSITEPDGTGDTVVVGDSYNITYDLSDPDDTVTVALFYDTDSTGLNGTAIGGCTAGSEGTGVTCSWNTTGVTPGSYYVYGVTNDGTNPDVTDYSPGQVTINVVGNTSPTLSITEPDGTGDTVVVGDSYNITYDLSDPDDTVTVALFYDTDSTGLNGTAIGGCTVGSEGTGVTCSWNTAGVAPGSYYVYGVTNDGTNPDVTDYSPGQVTINAVGNTPPMLSITEPDGTGDTVVVGDSYNITYDLSDPDDAVTVALFYDTNNTGLNGTAIGGCTAGSEGTGVTCSWNTAGVAPGSYYVYGVTNDGTNPDVTDYSPGQITISSAGLITLTVQPSAADSFIRDGVSSNNNFGAHRSIWLKNAIVSYQRRGLLGFDFTALDDSAVIESAYLDLYYFDNSIGVNPVGETVEVNRVTRTDWVEGETTWNVYKNSSSWTTAGGDYTVTDRATAVMPAAYGWVRWTVTDLIKFAKSNTSEIANLLVKFVSSASSNVGARFYTKEFTTDPSKQPKLIINYTTNAVAFPVSIPEITISENAHPTPSLSISEPDGVRDVVTVGEFYTITYSVADPDSRVTTALYYDLNNTGFNGTAIVECATLGVGATTCTWDTTGMPIGSYYVYGITDNGTNPEVKAYSPGKIEINAAGTGPLTVQPSRADSYMRDGAPSGNNYGDQDRVWLNTAITGYQSRGIFEFDFSLLDDSVRITSAYLDLYYFDNSIGNDPAGETVEVNRLLQTGWVEEEVTWDEYKRSRAWDTAGGDYTVTDQVTAVMPPDYGWVRWTVTEQVKYAQSNTSEILRMLVRFASDAATNSSAYFYSKDFTEDRSKRPKLTIYYTDQ